MPDRMHVIELEPPDVAWALGRAADEEEVELHEPPRRGHARPGDVLLGIGGTTGGAVTSLAGQVGEPAVRTDTNGRQRIAVPVAVDDDPGTLDDLPPHALDVSTTDLPGWIARLELAACRADRPSSPNLSAQLRAVARHSADVVLCHMLDPDPLIKVQDQWGLRHAEDLLTGLHLLGRLAGARQVLLVIDARQQRRIERRLRRAVAALQDVPMPMLRPLANTYPQSDPTLLTHTVLNRRLAPGELPTQAGVLLLDAVAAVGVGEVARGRACIRREPVVLRDHRRDLAVLCSAWRGARLSDVLMYAGMLHHDPDRPDPRHSASAEPLIRAGDYLRERVVPSNCIIGGGEVAFHVEERTVGINPDPCIRCGWCLEICPTGVHPAGTLEAAGVSSERDRRRLAERFGAAACIGCGLCDFVCPSRLPLRKVTLTVANATA